MSGNSEQQVVVTDGSRIVIEAMARAGADTFIGYPITPANLLYQYAKQRLPHMLPAPDEITVLQWMAGLSACGRIPFTATSFPGFALMIESINMAFMMELPMVIILVQRLGPATGTATCGAQGDIALLKGMISGGHQLPVLCSSGFKDSWEISAKAVQVAVNIRTPVVYLTSKEEMMTRRSFDLSGLKEIKAVERKYYSAKEKYVPYKPGDNLVPEFLPVMNGLWQVRLNASTHDLAGILQHSSFEAMENTRRLEEKCRHNLFDYTIFDLDEQKGAGTIIISYGISAAVSYDAVRELRGRGKCVSILNAKTLMPVPDIYYNIVDGYKSVVIVEENLNAQYARVMFGERLPGKVTAIGSVGRMISMEDILNKVEPLL